jgi:hypothetical protein
MMDKNYEEMDLTKMLYDVAEQKHDYILETESGSKENQIATDDFIKCMNVYRDLQKDTDDSYLENRRIDNEIETNRNSEKQRIWFDRFRVALDAGTLVLTGVGLVLSFATLKEYQDINLNTVITNKDAVKHADNLFNTMFRRLS